jgi:hypothetical protein
VEGVQVAKTGKSGHRSALDAPLAKARHDGGIRFKPDPVRGTRIKAPG